MQVQLETTGTLERRLTITLATPAIDAEVTKRLQRVARTAKIQGFRPGKAPMKLVEQGYGAQAREEVMSEQVQQSFAQALKEQGLDIAGYPGFEPRKTETPDAAEFTFSAVFEVYPEINVGDLSAAEIEKPVAEVSDAEIEKTLEVLRKQRSRFTRVERPAANGDRVIIDFAGTIDGEAFAGGSSENFPFELGAGRMLPEFEAGVLGMSEDETRNVNVVFPEDYHGADVAGKTAVFAITLKNVAAAEMPALDAEFAKSIGIADGDLDKMRAEIQKNVGRETTRRLQARVKENVMQALLDATPLELPKSLIALEINRLMQQAQQDMAERGMNMKDMPLPADLFEKQAERRVALGLILADVVEKNGLTAKPEQIKAMVNDFAESYEHPEDVVKWYYASQDRLDGPASLVLEENVVEFVLSKAKVTEKVVSFDDLMGKA